MLFKCTLVLLVIGSAIALDCGPGQAEGISVSDPSKTECIDLPLKVEATTVRSALNKRQATLEQEAEATKETTDDVKDESATAVEEAARGPRAVEQIEIPEDGIIIINRNEAGEVAPKALETAQEQLPCIKVVNKIEGVTLATCTPLVIRRLQTDFGVITTIEVGTEAIKKGENNAAIVDNSDIKKRSAVIDDDVAALEAEMEKMMAELESVRRTMSTDDAEFAEAVTVIARPARQAVEEECLMIVEDNMMACATMKIQVKRSASTEGATTTIVDVESPKVEEVEQVSGTKDEEGNVMIVNLVPSE